MDIALVEDTEHDINGEHGSGDKGWLVRERLLEHSCGALEVAVDRRRHAEGSYSVLDGAGRLAEGYIGGEIEGYRRCDEEPLMIDGKRRFALAEMGDSRQRHHVLARCADRGAGRCNTASGIGQGVRSLVARRIGCDLRRC